MSPFCCSPKVEANHSDSQSKSDSIQFAFSDKDEDNHPTPVQFGLALTAKRFSTVQITEIGDSAITDNDSVIFADHQSASDVAAKHPFLPVLAGNKFFHRNVSFSGVKSGSVYVDNFGDEERADDGSDVNSMSVQLQSFQRSISFDVASSPKKYQLHFDEGNAVEHNYEFKVIIIMIVSLCTVPHFSGALSTLQSSSIATKIHLYKSHTHTHTHTHTQPHTHTRKPAVTCKAETDKFLGQI